MPWRKTSPMDQRTQFIAVFLRETLSVTEICDLYDVSRKTAHMRSAEPLHRLRHHEAKRHGAQGAPPSAYWSSRKAHQLDPRSQ